MVLVVLQRGLLNCYSLVLNYNHVVLDLVRLAVKCNNLAEGFLEQQVKENVADLLYRLIVFTNKLVKQL